MIYAAVTQDATARSISALGGLGGQAILLFLLPDQLLLLLLLGDPGGFDFGFRFLDLAQEFTLNRGKVGLE